jgi:transposase
MEHSALGIDISSKRLDCYWSETGKHHSFDNTPSGITALLAQILETSPRWIIFEPTGGYETELAVQLSEAGIAFSMIPGNRLRRFAQSCGQLAKTDKMDAKLMAIYGIKMTPRPTLLGSKEQQRLSAWVTRRRQLVDLLSMEKQRSKQWGRIEELQSGVLEHCAYLKAEILKLEAQIEACIAEDSSLQSLSKELQEAKGIGPTTAAVLLADLPELGHIGSKEIAALVGVAPYNVESGNVTRKASIRGGRLSVRCTLYMATLVAIRHHPVIHEHYKHLREKQKPKKVAIVACMRKLLITLNAVARNHLQQVATEA